MMETQELVRQLAREKKRLSRRLKRLESTCAIDNDESRGDFGDQGQTTVSIAELLRDRKIIRHEIEEIDATLDLIERGLFGLCCLCKAMIPEERLEVYPHARKCVSCPKQINKKRPNHLGLSLQFGPMI